MTVMLAAAAGCVLVAVGVFVVAGLGWALICAGALTLAGVVLLYDPNTDRITERGTRIGAGKR